MAATDNTNNEKSTDFSAKASAKLEELKEEAGKLGEQLKDAAEDAWAKIKSADVQEELTHLKKEAGETLDEMAATAKGLWNNITGDDKNPPPPKPQDGPVK